MAEIIIERSTQRWGEHLKTLRIKSGKNHRTFGNLLDAHSTTVGRWEAGTRKPVREIPFYERLAGINGLTKQDVVELLLTQNAPRFIHAAGEEAERETGAKLGGLLRFYRERTGMSQRTFAGMYPESFDESTIARWEQGNRIPESNQFYDLLPNILHLSSIEYARLLLTGNPPQWMVPFLYKTVESDEVFSKPFLTSVRQVGQTSLRINIHGDLSKITEEKISALQGLIEQSLRGTLPNQ